MRGEENMLIIGKGLVITGDRKQPLIRDGGIVTERDKIVKVGDFDLLHREFPWAEVADAEDMIIMPGLINSREYIYREFSKGLWSGIQKRGEKQSLEAVWKGLGSHLTLSQIRMSAAAVCIESIKNGVTTVFDCARDGLPQGSLRTIGEVVRAMGMRACLCRQPAEWEGEQGKADADRENRDLAAYLEELGSPRLRGSSPEETEYGLGTEGYPHDMFSAYRKAASVYGERKAGRMLFEENNELARQYFGMPFGVLKPDAAADIIVVNYDPPVPVTEENIREHLLFGVNGTMTDTTICAGHVLMYHRKLLVADEKETMAHCRREARELAESIKASEGL